MLGEKKIQHSYLQLEFDGKRRAKKAMLWIEKKLYLDPQPKNLWIQKLII
jgi:hypothetical protein